MSRFKQASPFFLISNVLSEACCLNWNENYYFKSQIPSTPSPYSQPHRSVNVTKPSRLTRVLPVKPTVRQIVNKFLAI